MTRAGALATLGLRVQSSGAMATVERLAPVLGQHSREVLLGCGLSAPEVEALVRDGAVLEAAVAG